MSLRVDDESLTRGNAKYEALEAYSMSDKDIRDAIGIKPFLYTPDLHKVKHIDELFDKKGRCIVLYLTNSLTNGHWIALIKKGNSVLCWDSYGGYSADGQRKWLSHDKLVELGQDEPLLRNLLKESGYMISYNPYPYQSKEPDTNTCGKHCVTRLYYYKLSEDQYRDLIHKSGKTPDEFVVDFVYKRIGK